MLDKILRSLYFKVFFFALFGAILFAKSDRVFGWTNAEVKSNEPIMSDGSGYYAHLPQWFTYHTSHFEFAGSITQKYPKSRFTDFGGKPTERVEIYNKYYCGSAIGLIPFYGIAQIHAKSADLPTDGYSWPFVFWVNIGVIFISLLGGIGLFKLARLYKIKYWIAYLGVAVVLFGTNLCYYTTVEIPFAHVFAFTANTWFLVFAKQWELNNERKDFYWLSALFGWTIIIRPTNAFVVFVLPFLFKNTRSFFNRVKELFVERKVQLSIGLMLFLIFIVFHLYNVWLQTGEFKFNSYGEEGFDNWKNPEIWNVLFSWKKGLFVYTPVLILLFPAVISCYRKERRLFWGFLIVFALTTYTTAAWWMWWFGGGLGARNYVDFMALFILPVLILIQNSNWILKILFCSFAVLTSWIYIVYDLQMRSAILHYDKMNYENFSEVFLKTDSRFSWHADRNFQKKPEQTNFRSKELYFVDAGKREVKKRVMESDKNNLYDNPLLNCSLKELHSGRIHGKFGLEFTTVTRIYDHFNNPSVAIYLFKNDSLIEETSLQYGGKIRNQNEWSTVHLYFNMKTKWNDVDSVEVKVQDGLGNMAVKSAKAQFYSYK